MKIVIEISGQRVKDFGVSRNDILEFVSHEVGSLGGRFHPSDWRSSLLDICTVSKVPKKPSDIKAPSRPLIRKVSPSIF